jgi:hypothetical protein
LYDRLIYPAKTIRREGSGTSKLNDVIQDLLLSRWRRNRQARLSLDLPDLSNDACTLVQQGDDLLIRLVYLLSAGSKPSVGV